MAPNLTVLPGIDRKEQHKYTVKELEKLVEELKAVCDGFKESLEEMRSALGMSKIDFARWKDQSFEGIANLQSDENGLVKVIDDLTVYLEKL